VTDLPFPPMPADSWEQGYEDGESSQLADWMIALDEILPDDVECRPSQVAAYIQRLQKAAR
jgi:hypothetical protein